jgi:hypothetical protein
MRMRINGTDPLAVRTKMHGWEWRLGSTAPRRTRPETNLGRVTGGIKRVFRSAVLMMFRRQRLAPLSRNISASLDS